MKFRTENAPQKGFVTAGRALLLGSVGGYASDHHQKLREHVVPRMRLDRLTRVTTSDIIIMRLGSMLLDRLGPKMTLDVCTYERIGTFANTFQNRFITDIMVLF